MIFKSINGYCTFRFNGIKFSVTDTLETGDERLIAFLKSNKNFKLIEEVEEVKEEPKIETTEKKRRK